MSDFQQRYAIAYEQFQHTGDHHAFDKVIEEQRKEHENDIIEDPIEFDGIFGAMYASGGNATYLSKLLTQTSTCVGGAR